MGFYLGIDGGGTKTRCAVGDSTAVLGTSSAGGSNVVRVGAEAAKTAIQSAIRQALEIAQLPPGAVIRACIGAAGVSAPGVREELSRILAEILSAEIEVVGDHEIAFEAAFQGGPGVIVVAGTGSIAYARDQNGETARAGGYGYAISDEGSGHWIGRLAVSRTLAASDTGHSTCLGPLIAEAWGIRPDELVRTANASPAPDFARLFPVTLSAANAGDQVAIGVLQEAGLELARIAESVIRRLWQTTGSVGVALIGGVFENAMVVRESFAQALSTRCPNSHVLADIIDPVLGALWVARHGARNTQSL